MFIVNFGIGSKADIDRFADLIRKYTSFEKLDRFMLHELIDRITIYETPGMGRCRKGKEKLPSTTNLSGLFNKAKTASPMDAEQNHLALRPFVISSSRDKRQ